MNSADATRLRPDTDKTNMGGDDVIDAEFKES